MPIGRFGTTYVPARLVTSLRFNPVWVLRTATVTPGSTPPDVSRTVPRISPVVVCAAAGAEAAMTATRHNQTPLRAFLGMPV
jgi:hypothetical protein